MKLLPLQMMVSFTSGVGLGYYLNNTEMIKILLSFLLLLFVLSMVKSKLKAVGKLSRLVILLISLVSGLLHAGLSRNFVSDNHLKFVDTGRDLTVIGTVVGFPERTRQGGRFIVAVSGIETDPGVLRPVTGKILYSVSQEVWTTVINQPAFVPGVVLRIESPLSIENLFNNPGGFQKEDHLWRNGVSRTGSIQHPEFIQLIKTNSTTSWKTVIYNLRKMFLKQNQELKRPVWSLTEYSVDDIRAVSNALILGAKREISPDINIAFREAGLVHLLAISGLHVGIIASLISLILKYLHGTLLIRSVTTITATWIYAGLTGGSTSVTRAAVLVTIYFLARLMHRGVVPLYALFQAMSLLLVWNPLMIGDAGFQLTFSATFGIVAFTPHFQKLLARVPWRWLRNALAVSLAAQLATAPVSAYWFNRFSFLGFFTGLPLIPVTTLCLVSGICQLLFCWVPWAGSVISILHSNLLGVLIDAARLEADIPLVTVECMTPGTVMAFLLFTICLCSGLWSKNWILPAFLACGTWLFLSLNPLFSNDRSDVMDIWFLDVGNGDCTVIRFPDNRTMLVDSGGIFDSEFDVGEQIVLKTLRKIGIGQINIGVVTHPHPDHQLGFQTILKRLPVDELWVPSKGLENDDFQVLMNLCNKKEIKVRELEQRKLLDHLKLNTNNRSLVLSITYGRFRLLLPGDAELESEESLLDYGPAIKSTVLKVGHHGSRSSSGRMFLERVLPEIIMIPSGRNNQFGHPHYSVLTRIHRILPDTSVFRSDRNGMIHIVTDGYKVDVEWFTQLER